MSLRPASIRKPWRRLRGLWQPRSPAFWRDCAFYCFWLSLALFPIGYGFREVMPPLCLLLLMPWYRMNWPDTTLARLGAARWLFLAAGAMTLLGVIFSIHPFQSFLHACMGLNKAYILPFVAMECARDAKDLRRLCWACAFACFWQGLDGLWQAFTGQDFIMGYPHHGRLTGSLGDYTVGNYLALALVPAFGCWPILRACSLPPLAAAFLCAAIFWPAAFLFLEASSRSGILAIAGAFCLWALMRHGWRNWRWLALPAGAIGLFLLFEGHRFAPEAVLQDNRWDLWRLAWLVFLAHPWLGAGAGQYNAAFRALGLAPEREVLTISHPHNMYLDLLYAHGLIGFCLGLAFLFGFLFWLLRAITPHIRQIPSTGEAAPYWQLTAWFALGYAAWLVNGVFGHDFYRIWWLALAMCNLGIAIGAIVNAPRQSAIPASHTRERH